MLPASHLHYTKQSVYTHTQREQNPHANVCTGTHVETQVLRWQTGIDAHAAGTHLWRAQASPSCRPPCLQVTVTRQPLPGGHVPLANGKCTNGVLSNSLPQHPCTSDMVSLFQGYIKNCHLMLKCPRRSRCCEGCPPFYCYRN